MASPSDSLPTSASFTADRVTQCGEIRPEGREGERDRPNRVNTLPDAFEWTLLAWRRLQAIRRFILINAMRLYATCRQVYGEGKEVMTSEERREARYQRRTEARARKKAETSKPYSLRSKPSLPRTKTKRPSLMESKRRSKPRSKSFQTFQMTI